ncbi:MAG TPA: cyclase family protein [Vicinamibacterales bacterium]|nr:cyclase family protein [Vicinamibacterales bacterium]
MKRTVLAWWCALLAAPASGQDLDLARYRLIDLTHPFNEETVYWPTAPSTFKLTRDAWGETPGGYFYSSFSLCTPEHGGTHLDAPLHFAADAASTADVPLERLIAPAVVIDVRRAAEKDRNYRVTRADIEAFERTYGPVAAGTIVLIHTGWSRFWPDRQRYLGDAAPGPNAKLSFPGVGEDAARLLAEERGIALLGIDTASIDYGPSTDFIAHRIGAARGVGNLENLTNLDQLPPRGAIVVALPMKIDGGSGGPARVVALVPKP